MLKIIRINILIFLGLLLLIEVGGQLLSLVKNKQFLFDNREVAERSHLFYPHPYLSVALKKNADVSFMKNLQFHSVKTTEWGTRWTGADLNDTTAIRIACLGGSTTFCTGIADEESWPAILQTNLGKGYAVVNYGVPAYKSVEAIIQLALFVAEIKPHIVIFYQGGNDFYNYHMENTYPDFYYHGEVLMPAALLATHKYESGFEKFKRSSGLFYIVNNLKELFQEEHQLRLYTVSDPVVDSLYVRNIRSQLALTGSMNAKEFFIGQVLNPHAEREDNKWGGHTKSEYVLPLMDSMNKLAAEVCESDTSCTYIDLWHSLNWQPVHFWDDMHFTKEGSALFAKAIEKEIRSFYGGF